VKPCIEPGCPALVGKGESRCTLHQPEPWQGRATFEERYGISRNQWTKIRRRAIRRDGGRCAQCGATGPLQVDHITPVSKGGGHELSNLQTLCGVCHDAKTATDRKAQDG